MTLLKVSFKTESERLTLCGGLGWIETVLNELCASSDLGTTQLHTVNTHATCYVLLTPVQCPVHLSELTRVVALCFVAHVSVCVIWEVSLQVSTSCSLRQSFLTVLSEKSFLILTTLTCQVFPRSAKGIVGVDNGGFFRINLENLYNC